MSGAQDPREPRPCPRCGQMCVHDGWDHVHPDGIGIGSCTVLDGLSTAELADRLAETWRAGRAFHSNGRIDWLIFAAALKGEDVQPAWLAKQETAAPDSG